MTRWHVQLWDGTSLLGVVWDVQASTGVEACDKVQASWSDKTKRRLAQSQNVLRLAPMLHELWDARHVEVR